MESKDMNKFITFLLFLCQVPMINAQGRIWTLGNYLYIYTGESKSWRNAKLDCERRGARLATVDSRAISNSLVHNLHREVWIGGHRDGLRSNWKWVDGTNLSWTNWYPGEPGNSNENCILVKQNRQKKWNNFSCHARTGVLCEKVIVPSSPTLVRVDLVDCNVTVTVTWIPHLRASRHWHNITVTNIRNNGDSHNTLHEAKDPETQMKTEFQLKPKTTYRIAVAPCRSRTDCMERYVSQNTTFTTTVLSGRVNGVQLSQSPPYSCGATWNKLTPLIPGQQIKYKIIINESLSYIPRGSSTVDAEKQLFNTTSQVSYHFKGKPNRKYRIGVQAETCNLRGNISWSEGICVTDPKAPEILQKPQISERIRQGTLAIQIDIPSEENGEISCLFVIVRVANTKKRMESKGYNIDDLVKANSSTDEYIAVSQKMITKQQLELTLGDGGQSECYASSTTSKRQKREANVQLFVGRNLRINQTRNHSVFIVSLSPSISGFLVKAGDITEVNVTPVKDDIGGPKLWEIIGAAIGAILAIIVVAVAVICWKKKNASEAKSDLKSNAPRNVRAELGHHKQGIQPHGNIQLQTPPIANTRLPENNPHGYDAVNFGRQEENGMYYEIRDQAYEPIRIVGDAL